MVKYLRTTVKVLFAILLLAVAGVLVWLRQDVRSLEWARPYITAALNSPDAPYVANYSEASVDWRDWSQFGLLQIKNVTVTGHDGTVFAALPAMYVSFDPLALLTHRHSLNTILLYKPKLFFARDVNKVVRLGVESDTAAIPMANLLAFFSDGDDGAVNLNAPLPFRRLVIDRATLTFTDTVTGSSAVSSSATFKLARSSGGLEASVTLPFIYNNAPGSIDASLRRFSRHRQHVMNAALDHVPAQIICLVAVCPDGMDVTGTISGKASVSLNDAAQPIEANADLAVENAVVTAPEIFAEPLVIAHGLVQAQVSEEMHQVQLSRMALSLADTALEITGKGWREAAGWNVHVQALGTKPLEITKLYKYWPLPLAPKSREWVLGSMKAGRGDAMTLTVKLAPADFTAPVLPDTAVDANLAAQGMTVEYLPGFPLMKNVNGNVHFTGTSIRIDTTSGSAMTGTALQHATILFPDLNKEGTPIEITAALQAPAKDAATILGLKYFTFDDPLHLNPDTIKGSVDAVLKLKFNAFSQEVASDKPRQPDEIDFSHVDYDIATNLHDIAQEKFVGKIDVAGVSGPLTASNAGMDFDGSLLLGGATALKFSAKQKSGEDVVVNASGSIGHAQLLQFGVPDAGYISEGTASVKAEMIARRDDLLITHADLDLKDLAVKIPELSWHKKRGVPGTLSIEHDTNKAGQGTDYRFHAKADDLVIAGATISTDAKGALVAINAPSVKTAHNDFTANYRTRADGFDVSLSGKRLDASTSYAKNDSGLLKDFPPIRLTLDLAELVLDPHMPIANLKGFLHCNTQRCDAANIRATIGKGTLSAVIDQKAGARQLQLLSNNAGDLLRAVSFTDRLYGGGMELKGSYDDSKHPPLFVGRTIVTNFKLKNSAILARILSIGSLTGLSNALTGDGIAFNKFAASVGQQSGVIVVKEGAAHGTAMGITVGGTIDTTSAKLQLKGVVVPAYALNSLIGKIPIVGALAGGEGEGLIAFNYNVDGTYDNPDVNVNPLSGLTPGFLRGIFGAFDKKEKKPAPENTKPESPSPESLPEEQDIE